MTRLCVFSELGSVTIYVGQLSGVVYPQAVGTARARVLPCSIGWAVALGIHLAAWGAAC